MSASCLIASAVIGVGARFFELGAAPLATDEFYLISSVQQILQHGLPRFDCGGLYIRGIIFQYLVAPVLWVGLSAETSARLVAGIVNLAALPAVYLLSRRAAGATASLMCSVFFLLSLWEIEFSRFGRMYAPYQALFLWYIVFLLRAVFDNNVRAKYVTFSLAILAPLVWEGGALLAVLNFTIPLLSRARVRLTEFMMCIGILAAALFFAKFDFRHLGEPPPFPPDFVATNPAPSIGGMLLRHWPIVELARAYAWWPAIALMTMVVIWIGVKNRELLPASPLFRWTIVMGTVGLIVGLFGASLGLFALALLAFADKDQDIGKIARWLAPTIIITGTFWTTCLIQIGAPWSENSSIARDILVRLFKYPNVLDPVFYPWVEAMPILAASFGGLAGLTALLVIVFRKRGGLIELRFLVLVCVTLIFLIGVTPTIYSETRYTFFMFPLIYIIAAGGLLWAIRNFLPTLSTPRINILGSAVLAFLFIVSEDFNPRHLMQISRPDAIYRQNFSAPMQNHLYFRIDFRSVGRYIDANRSGDDIVISAIVPATYYIDDVDAIYMPESSPLFRISACNYGSIERWTNLPLLTTKNQFLEFVQRSRTTWLVMPNAVQSTKFETIKSLFENRESFMSPDGAIRVFRFATNDMLLSGTQARQ